MEFLGALSLILIVTAFAGHFSRRIGIPAVIGQLLVGIIMGPAVLGEVHNDAFMHYFSEIGVIILMFIAGLESDLKLLKKYLRPAFAVAVSGVIFPIILIYFFGRLFHFSNEEAIFLGVTFSATSVSISVEVLKELKKLKSKEGTTILGAAVIDDIISVIILSVLISIFSNVASAQGGHHSSNLIVSFLLDASYFVVIYLLFEWIAPYMMRLSEKLTISSSVVLMSLVLCLSMAWLAEKIGLSDVVGSFFAGIAIAQTPYKQEVDSNIEPIGYAVFIPTFFVSIGLNMSFKGFWDDLIFIIPLTLLALLTKWLGCGLGARLLGMDFDSMNVIGSGMVSRGEMALIIAQIGFEAHLLSIQYYSAVIFVIILTTLAAPFMLKAAIRRQLSKEQH